MARFPKLSRWRVISALLSCYPALGACHMVAPYGPHVAQDAAHDAGTPDTAVGDVGAASDSAASDGRSASCLPWPETPSWSSPRLVGLNGDGDSASAFLSADRLQIYFSAESSAGLGGRDIFVASRPEATSPFGAPRGLPAPLNSLANEFRFVLAPDGRHFFLSTDRLSGTPDLWQGEITSGGAYELLEPLEQLNTEAKEHDPWIDFSQTTLYFGREGDELNAIWLSERTDMSSAWSAPRPLWLFGVNVVQYCGNPVLSSDGYVLLFNHKVTQTQDFDIWYARRARLDQPFQVVGPFPQLRSDAYEGHMHLSADGCTLYFTSWRNGHEQVFWSTL